MLPKKGDIRLCKYWRGIVLLSIPSKVFSRSILETLKHALDHKQRCEQVGFRKDKSCTDHITFLRIIIEQSTDIGHLQFNSLTWTMQMTYVFYPSNSNICKPRPTFWHWLQRTLALGSAKKRPKS